MNKQHIIFAGLALVAVAIAFPRGGGDDGGPLGTFSSYDREESTAEREIKTYSTPNPWSSDAVLARHRAERRIVRGAGGPTEMDRRLAESGGSSSMGGRIALAREGDGHFYASPYVDGQPIRMMVDTGASMIALTGRDAMAIGVDWNPAEVRPIARGASGDVYGVPVMLDNVTLGGLSASNVRAVVIPEGLDVTLLGQSFLSQVGKVEISGDQMVLSD